MWQTKYGGGVTEVCSFDGCDRPRQGRQDVCRAHYFQRYKGKPLTPIRTRPKKDEPRPECSVDGCTSSSQTLNMCAKHYAQELKRRTQERALAEGRVCSFDGCDRPKYGRKDVCQTHHSQRRAGQKLRPIRKQRKPGEPILECSFDGCDRPRIGLQDVCYRHYCQRREGKPLTPIQARHKKGEPRPECSIEGCDRSSKLRGMCPQHYAQDLRRRTQERALAEGRICSFDGCDRPKFGRQDVCHQHYNQRRAGKELRHIKKQRSSDDPVPVCSFDGCDRLTHGQQDVCYRHYCHRREGRPLKPIRVRPKRSGPRPQCAVPGCSRLVHVRDLCKTHYGRVQYHWRRHRVRLKANDLTPIKERASSKKEDE